MTASTPAKPADEPERKLKFWQTPREDRPRTAPLPTSPRPDREASEGEVYPLPVSQPPVLGTPRPDRETQRDRPRPEPDYERGQLRPDQAPEHRRAETATPPPPKAPAKAPPKAPDPKPADKPAPAPKK